ncbi:MAG: NAD(P)H-hydrate epimerase [bacterium]
MKLKAVTPLEMKEIDGWAIQGLGIPSIVLMEHAGFECAKLIVKKVKGLKSKRILIICGKGGNGGDGMVVGRGISPSTGSGRRGQVLGIRVALLGKGNELKSDTEINFRIIGNLGIPFMQIYEQDKVMPLIEEIKKADVIVDAIFGFGFRGEVGGIEKQVIDAINNDKKKKALVFSIDVPSGLNAGTGDVGGAAVKADTTITLHLPKTGLLKKTAKKFVGKLFTVDIGIPYRSVG